VKRIVLLDDYQGVALDYGGWDRVPEEWQIVALEQHIGDPDELVEALREAEIVVAMRERTAFPAAVLERLADLRLLITTGMANVAIDVAAARRQGILVCGTAMHPPGTAELTWGLILSLLRHIPAEDAAMRSGGWQSTIGGDLEGATLGLVGFGRLGRRMATVAQAFGMEVLAWSQHLDPAEARAAGVEPVEKRALFERADIVSVHYKLSERSRGLVGAAELAAMKPSAYLVNTSRGAAGRHRGAGREAPRGRDRGRRPRRLRHRATARRPLPAQDPPHRPHPAHRLRHRGHLRGLLRRRGRGRARLPGRLPGPGHRPLTGRTPGVSPGRRRR
jgi:lactate dehydrogenase-like 2-hydroxyacid dehydrogenase